MNKPLNITLSLLFIALNLLQTANAQSEKQRELEERRVALQREIAQINTLLFEKKSEKKSKLTVIEELNHKIKVRENLIKVTNQQANLLTREIDRKSTRLNSSH